MKTSEILQLGSVGPSPQNRSRIYWRGANKASKGCSLTSACSKDAYCFLLSSFSGVSQPGTVFPACQRLSAMCLRSRGFAAEKSLCHLTSFSGSRKFRGSAAPCTSYSCLRDAIWTPGAIPPSKLTSLFHGL